MLKIFPIVLLFICLSFSSNAQKSSQVVVQKNQGINWVSFSKALESSKVDGKPLFIDIYTSWCGYCIKMDQTTFQDSSVIAYINENFHAVKFNAEGNEKVMFQDTLYTNPNYKAGQARNSTHQLALKLTNNQPAYPTISYYVGLYSIIAPVPGMQTVESIQPFLFYFGEQAYTSTNLWEVFMKGYSAPKFNK